MKKRALISVTDKTGITDFARQLIEQGFELVSTGGTAAMLREAGCEVQDVSQVTGFPELLDGRIKTLHPRIHGGLLGNVQDRAHVDQMQSHSIEAFQIVCVNLYAFERTVSGPHTFAEAVESIDIGGPAMIRAAAKNSLNVAVVVDPQDYAEVLARWEDAQFRRDLMAKAFAHTAYYDATIAAYLNQDEFPEQLTLSGKRLMVLRYGENPHQSASLYSDSGAQGGIARAKLLNGKELSYNNLLDADGAWELVSDLPEGSVAIIKHGNPCGVASKGNLAASYQAARDSDTVSAFGGIAAFHGILDLAGAEAALATGNFLEVIIATGFAPGVIELIAERKGWGSSVRVLQAEVSPTDRRTSLRTIRGGFLVQDWDESPGNDWTLVTQRALTQEEERACQLMWKIIPHVKSNAIVVGNSTQMLGAGAGQMNRVQSVRLALEQAGQATKGAILASDAFFPFNDSILTAAAAGITAIVQPGGSKRDQDSIDAANEHGLAMVFTGTRHFRH